MLPTAALPDHSPTKRGIQRQNWVVPFQGCVQFAEMSARSQQLFVPLNAPRAARSFPLEFRLHPLAAQVSLVVARQSPLVELAARYSAQGDFAPAIQKRIESCDALPLTIRPENGRACCAHPEPVVTSPAVRLHHWIESASARWDVQAELR